MTATVNVELAPFSVPEVAFVQSSARLKHAGLASAVGFSLSELDAETLSSLCDEWRASVFGIAGKADPQKSVPGGVPNNGQKIDWARLAEIRSAARRFRKLSVAELREELNLARSSGAPLRDASVAVEVLCEMLKAAGETP
jgi:hypothetical protein